MAQRCPSIGVIFARECSLAVIMRHGPQGWSQLVLWDTEKDIFTPGQWVRARIFLGSLSPDGSYLALSLRTRKRIPDSPSDYEVEEYTTVCKPPYFTALAFNLGLFENGNVAAFDEAGSLYWQAARPTEIRGRGLCPFPIVDELPEYLASDPWVHWLARRRAPRPQTSSPFLTPICYDDEWKLEAPAGRTLLVRYGHLYDASANEPRLLFDPTKYRPEQVETPEWAKLWDARPQ